MDKEFLEIVGNGKPTGSVSKETIAVSSIRVEKLHQQIRLRILSCSKMNENHREHEVPEAEVPVVECLDCFPRITLEELAIPHFVKNGTIQNACSTRPKSGCRFGEKCSFAHRQVEEQPTTRSKKSAVAMSKKYELHERTEKPFPKRDTHHEQGHGPVVCNSSSTR